MSEATSSTYTATAPSLTGTWLHDPINPDDSERGFLYASDRSESLEVSSTRLELVGRRYAVTEFGEGEVDDIDLKVFLPFTAEHDAHVAWWLAAVRARRPLCYRDNRGRLAYVTLAGVSRSDDRAGTTFGMTLERVDFRAVAA
jgi:hypothetical protein